MASLIATPALNAGAYRHFAAITLALTACVALFADGEARQAIDDEVTAREQRAAFEQASTRKFGSAKLGDRRKLNHPSGRFGQEQAVYSESFDYAEGGQADERIGDYRPLRLADGGVVADGGELEVLNPDQLDALTPTQRAAYFDQVRRKRTPQTTTPTEISREQIGALMAASASRSGSEGID